MTERQIEALLRSVRSWPKEDRDQLYETARDIEARRSGHYRAGEDELAAIDDADQPGAATRQEVDAAFETFRRA